MNFPQISINERRVLIAATYVAALFSAVQLGIVLQLLIGFMPISIGAGLLFFLILVAVHTANLDSKSLKVFLFCLILLCKIGPAFAESLDVHGLEIDRRIALNAADQNSGQVVIAIEESHALKLSHRLIYVYDERPKDILIAITMTLFGYIIFDLLAYFISHLPPKMYAPGTA